MASYASHGVPRAPALISVTDDTERSPLRMPEFEEGELLLEQATLLERKLEISLNQAGISTTESTTETSADDFAVQVRNQIQAGKNRRDDSFLASFYQSKITSFGTSALDQQQFTSV